MMTPTLEYTGGNCTAWFYRVDAEHHVLVTGQGDNLTAPDNFATRCTVYLYADARELPIAYRDVQHWGDAREALGEACPRGLAAVQSYLSTK